MMFVSVVAAALVVLMAGPALAHVCFNAAKPDGAGSAGTADIIVDISIVDGEELGFEFIPGPDLKLNPKNGRVIGGFVTTTVTVKIWDPAEYPAGVPEVTLVDIITKDLFFQNTVGGQAHFSGPGADGCDGVGIDSLEVCLLG